MKLLVIGSGGREHALAWRLAQSPLATAIYVTPGNPGCETVARCVAASSNTPQGYLALARDLEVDLTVVGPEAPLVAGVVDAFRLAGQRIVGPTAAAARLEGSKSFAKNFMLKSGIPTAGSAIASSRSEAAKLLPSLAYPLVLKADGLAAGKGVVIAPDRVSAEQALPALPEGAFVLEEFLTGEEVSFIAYVDERGVFPLEASQDHKTIFDGDQGPNTGGMGAYCDGRILNRTEIERIMATVIHPTVNAMAAAGTPYSGFLYAGLMMTAGGPRVLEFNCRLGDPETQALLHRLDSDLAALFLDGESPRWKTDPSVCVVMAAHGYPETIRTGDAIQGLDTAQVAAGPVIFHAGTTRRDGNVVTSGGRVLGVTASGPTLQTAIDAAYARVARIRFDGMQYRTDIGKKGLRRW